MGNCLAETLTFAAVGRCPCQAAPEKIVPWETIGAGGAFSSYRFDYGQRLLLGASVYVDVNYSWRYGIEAEGRWLWLHQRDGVRASTYLIGPRFQFRGLGDEQRRFRPYGKFLVGAATFRYPYHYATGEYFVLAPGGGVDYRLNSRLRLRLADVEYQAWPQFTYGKLSSFGVSSGLRVRLF